jgi:hypothetical protein
MVSALDGDKLTDEELVTMAALAARGRVRDDDRAAVQRPGGAAVVSRAGRAAAEPSLAGTPVGRSGVGFRGHARLPISTR